MICHLLYMYTYLYIISHSVSKEFPLNWGDTMFFTRFMFFPKYNPELIRRILVEFFHREFKIRYIVIVQMPDDPNLSPKGECFGVFLINLIFSFLLFYSLVNLVPFFKFFKLITFYITFIHFQTHLATICCKALAQCCIRVPTAFKNVVMCSVFT